MLKKYKYFLQVLLGGGRRHWLPKVAKDPEANEEGRRLDGRNLIDDWVRDKKKRSLRGEYVWNKKGMDEIDPAKVDHLLGEFILIVLRSMWPS